MKIFISSTYIDLKDYRQVAIEVANRYECAPLAMEFFMAQPDEPTKVCDKEIHKCDILVGIYAHRYGFIPDGQKKSITQQEYELAKALGKDCLCFIVQDEFPWNPKFIEHDKQQALKDFLATIKNEKTVAYFTTPADFESKVSASLGKLLLEKTSTNNEERKQLAGKHLIPIAPTPFIAHPYPLPPHFTGREAEKALLSNWLHNGPEPMLVLEAIGGMGKTALSWVWLQQEVLAKNAELDGVLWWSFYDEPFEAFGQSLFFYLTSKEVRVERGALSDQLSVLHSILYNNRFLLILDGFERALRGYAGMKAMFMQEKGLSPQEAKRAEEEWDRRQREPVHPQASQFLRRLATGKCKTLLTTRLFPAPLEEVTGVRHERLAGLSPNDSVRFFRSEGLTGTRAEMERAAAVYGNHPLMLKLLSTALRRKRAKDMTAAFKLDLIDQAEPQKILATSFNLLSKDEQQVATTVAVFRSSFGFDAAKALFPEMPPDRLWEFLQGLQQLGLLFYDEGQQQFDFHPILRSFLYDHLTKRDAVHQRAVVYFEALPAPEKVVTLADIAPVIERYHHLIGAGKFDEAIVLFRGRLHSPIYYRLANYNLAIELLRALFPEGENYPPHLQAEADQAWTLHALAACYALSGQTEQAVRLYMMQNALREKSDDKGRLAEGLGDVAQNKIRIGQLSAGASHLRKSIAICHEIKDEVEEATGHQEWGRVLAYQGRLQKGQQANRAAADEPSTVESELAKSTAYWKSLNKYQALSIDSVYLALSFLLQARLSFFQRGTKENTGKLALQALQQASEALSYSERDAETDHPTPRDFVRAYWLLGEALLQCLIVNASLREQKLEIHFYDEPFQQITETLRLQKDNALNVAERCLSEALRRCRSVNMVQMEPDLLLAWGKYQWVSEQLSVNSKKLSEEKFAEMEETIKEAREIAERAGYRLALADIHLFCAEVLLDLRANVETQNFASVLGLSIEKHLRKAKEYALDVSEYSHLYQSQDPHFYDGIPEAAMLKRGMTHQERIDNGYWVAYKIAEALEERYAEVMKK